MHVVIAGCGYVGRLVGAGWRRAGARVSGAVRTHASADPLAAAGIEPVIMDFDTAVRPLGAELIYYFAPPPPEGEDDPRLASFMEGCGPGAARVVYISTSGVYGDRCGAWVTESDPITPLTPRARRRAAAEQWLTAWAARHGTALTILRVPGIYGPGRLPLERLRAGEPVVREQEAPWSNRIHVHDLARICVTLGGDGAPAGLFNVSDGCPTTMTAYFNAVADHFGLPRPPQVSLEEARRRLSPMAFSFWSESRRLDIGRLRQVTGFEPRYPTVAAGLAAEERLEDGGGAA